MAVIRHSADSQFESMQTCKVSVVVAQHEEEEAALRVSLYLQPAYQLEQAFEVSAAIGEVAVNCDDAVAAHLSRQLR
jgi:hypothetical protein